MLQSLIDFDIQALNAIREFFFVPGDVFRYSVLITADVQWILMALFLVAYWLVGTYGQDNSYKITSLNMFYMIAGAFILYVCLNQFLPIRERPEIASILPPLIDHLPDNSFPSGHAIFSGASALAMAYFVRGYWMWIMIISGLAMNLARIVAGVHYPGDIIAGYVIGLLGAHMIYLVLKRKIFVAWLNPFFLKLASYLKL